MKKFLALYVITAALVFGFAATAFAASYTVQKGDTLWTISKKHNVSFQDLLNANQQIKNPDLIYPNQKINIPQGSSTSTNTPSADSGQTSQAAAVLNLVNQERAKHGLKALTLSDKLTSVATTKSKDMATKNYFSHTSPTYGSPFDMLKHFGISYRSAGENIAAGQRTPAEVMNAWMNSSGHRANILNAKYTQLGVGYYKGGSYGTYWTQLFIGT